MKSHPQAEGVRHFRPLRAADLEDRVQELGRGLGDLSPASEGEVAGTLETSRIIDALRPYILFN